MTPNEKTPTVKMNGQADYYPGASKALKREIVKALSRGLNPAEVALFKRADKDAFKHVDEKGRLRNRG